jgi:hypothetical protein
MLALTVLVGLLFLAQPPAPQSAPTALERLRTDAAAVRPLVEHDCVKGFVDAVAVLPEVSPRVVYYQRDPKAAFSEEEAARLPREERDQLRKLDFDTAKYYDTFYGSPLGYSRALDLCAAGGLRSYDGKRIVDYGYGTSGHLRLLAANGAEVTGADVDPILRILYSQSGDQGKMPASGPSGRGGTLTLVDGFWPGTPRVRADVGARYDLFISKNTLKNGYVHPAEGVDKRRTLTLGVTDDEFVRALFETLNPGGLVMIYNIGPAPAAEGKPVIPWADIRCPFPRAMWESAGFKVIEFDRDDKPRFVPFARALGWDKGDLPMDLENDLFVSYTLVRRP